MIKALILDIGGVLIKYSENPSNTKLLEYLQITPEVYEEAFSKMRKKLSIGEITEDEGWKLFCTEIKKPVYLEFFKSEYRKQMKEFLQENNLINNELIELLKKFKTQGVRLAALPNTTIMNTDVYTDLGVYSFFNFVVTSFQEKMKKPNPLFFKKALDLLKVTPEETIFIDDSPWHVDAAKKLGMKAILYEDNIRLINTLKSFGLSIH